MVHHDAWSVHPQRLAERYSRVHGRLNGWGQTSVQFRDFWRALTKHMDSAIESGKLRVRNWDTGFDEVPAKLAEMSPRAVVELQDFCDWANAAGQFGCPKGARELASSLGLTLAIPLGQAPPGVHERLAARPPKAAPLDRPEAARVPINDGATVHAKHAEPAPADAPPETREGLQVKRTPQPLTTRKIADAFADIDGQTAQQWRDKLGDVNNHRWLLPARAARNSAPRPSTWWPLKFADLLEERGTTLDSLKQAFLHQPALKPWLAEWQEAKRERNAFGA